MSKTNDHQKLRAAVSLHQTGNLDSAANLYREIIEENPNNLDAYHYLGVIEAGIGNFEKAKLLMAHSLSIQPPNIQFIENYAAVLFRMGDFKSALQVCQQGLEFKNTNATLLYISSISLFKLNKFQESLFQFDRLLEIQPNNTVALNERGSVLAEMKRYGAALASVEKALAFNITYPEAHLNKGNVYCELKQYEEAITAFDKALSLEPRLANAWLGRGNAFRGLQCYDEAFGAYDKALSLEPHLANAWLGRGNAFDILKRYDEAIAAYDKALRLEPGLAEAWLGRGNVYYELKSYDEAFAAYDKALEFKPDLESAWLGRGNLFTELKRYDEAFAAYDKALGLRPGFAEAWLGRGNVYYDLKCYDEAFAAYDKALELKPSLESAWLGRGNLFTELKRYDEAFAAYDKALGPKPDSSGAWLGRGNLFTELKCFDEAFSAYDKAFGLAPDLIGLEGARLNSKLNICNWSNFSIEYEHLFSSVKNHKTNIAPFTLLAMSKSPEDQLKIAKLWIRKNYPPSDKPFWHGEVYQHNKIRIAYVSADFHQHATSHLMAGLFECHDKSKFEVTAISIGPDDNSEMRHRLKNTFENFIDARLFSDDEIAHRIRQAEVDILIDLKGFTQDARVGIFARRPAPVQVNYLGYPGTMGADYIDYLVADHTVIPKTHQAYYAEKIVYLPNSYQANDTKRPISDRVFTRAELELPEGSFIFCCFNNNYKILPDVFDCWMRILKRTDGSVLWLFENNATAQSNLRKEAVVRGISAERLVFAPRMQTSDHLARHRLADLFLDTLPYNAHTTASDALWAGLPVLTCLGEAFAGRVAASLLHAIGLPELITTTIDEYEQLAIDLATHPERLGAVKCKLAENRLTMPLFDTKLFTKHIERAYVLMYERHRAGSAPDHIRVSD